MTVLTLYSTPAEEINQKITLQLEIEFKKKKKQMLKTIWQLRNIIGS